MTEVVCDAGPLIHLDELNCLELLSDFDKIIVPEAVWEEVFRNRPSALNNSKLTKVKVSRTDDVEYLSIIRAFSLDEGEQAALSIMKRDSWAIRRRQRSPEKIIAFLQSIPNKSTLYIHPTLLKNIITQIQHETSFL